jgi:hypothetical protein
LTGGLILLETNVKPGFKNPGNTMITSADQLKYFDNYTVGKGSALRKTKAYNWGIKKIAL